MMIKFIILHILVSVYVRGQNSEPPPPTDMVSDFWTGDDWISAEYCCEMKVVGGKKYKLVGSSYDAYDYGCTSDCTYMTEGSDVKYCFRPGKFESECTDEGYGSRPPMTGPTGTRPPRPPMTTGGRPPMTTGGEPPMTTGGEPPMTTGGEPPMTTGEPGTGSPGGASTASTADYCSLNSDHTMCKYTGPSASCSSKTIFRELSADAKKAILDKHNDYRRRVAKGEETGGINSPQPKASNMKKLVWNNELELVAQRWADQCTFGHDSVRGKLDGTSVGQNAYWGGNSQEQAESAVQAGMEGAAKSWYDEVTDPGFDSQTINPYTFNSGTGHYTQVVWAETEELGCGMVYYKGDSFYETLIVCNYAVAGNLIGSEMYKTGEACAACPSGYTCDDGLCAKE